jgi:hypothetical protein
MVTDAAERQRIVNTNPGPALQFDVAYTSRIR